MNTDHPRQRYVEVVLPGRRQLQAVLADALELAEEFFVAREIKPRVGQGHGRRLGVDGQLGIGVLVLHGRAGIAGLAVLIRSG